MNKSILILLILTALFVLYVVLGVQEKGENKTVSVVRETVEIEGVVTAIDRSELMLDGPTRITIITNTGEYKSIAVPSMGINLCVAAPRIADVGELAVGDTVRVHGGEDEAGTIVPCEGDGDQLMVVGMVQDVAYGYTFNYRKGPQGYVTLEDTMSDHEDYLTGVVLYDAREYEALMTSTDAREGPPALRVRVYQNPEELSASAWALRHSREVNRQLIIGEESTAAVGGVNAVQFTTDGLFTTKVYVVAEGLYIYVLMGDSFDATAHIVQDFTDLVASFTLVPAVGQSGTGAKIDPRVVCESALAFMSFTSGAEAEAFVAACVNGEHPEVIERYIRDNGLDGATI